MQRQHSDSDLETSLEDVAGLIQTILEDMPEPSEEIIFEDTLLQWFYEAQRHDPPRLNHPRISLYANEKAVYETFEPVRQGQTALNQFAEHIDADLRLYELSNRAGGDFSDRDMALAITYGLMGVSDGLDCLVLIGHEEDAAKHGAFPELSSFSDPHAAMDFLKDHAHDRHGAIIGAILAARKADVPTMITDPLSLSAARFLGLIDERLISHCLYAGPIKCAQKALLSDLNLLVIDNDDEEMMAQTALSLIAHWQSLFYPDRDER